VRAAPSVRRVLLAAATAALILPATATAAPAACRGADVAVTPATVDVARVAVRCLHNQVRAAHGLPRLHGNTRLRLTASAYSRQMVRGHFFDHVSPTGSTLVTRVRASGYLRRVGGYSLGENIGWGQGELATPRSMVRAWMNSPGHRRNMLEPRFHEMGIGIALGTPGGSGGATYTTGFGTRC
jgi:uncharacterized protein YkwD